MRCIGFIILSATLLTACQAIPNAQRVSMQSADADQVRSSLDRWPRRDVVLQRRPFTAQIKVPGVRSDVTGILEFYGPRDFRLRTWNHHGETLFDGRVDWAGPKVFQHIKWLDQSLVVILLQDVQHAFEMPAGPTDLQANTDKMVIERRMGTGIRYRWFFDRSNGRLIQSDVNIGLLDTLHIYYHDYSRDAWPRQVQLVRPARLYDFALTFTE